MNLFSSRSYEHYRDYNHVFSGVIGFAFAPFGVRGDGLDPESVGGLYVSANYFPVLGVHPVVGRLIGPEDVASSANVAVVSWSYWKSRFNFDRSILGRSLLVDNFPVTIVGVAPREFVGLEPGFNPDIWVPTALDLMVHPSDTNTTRYWLKLAARLKPGVSIDQARAEMTVLFQWTIEDEFKRNDDRSVRAWKMEVQPAGSGLSRLRDQFENPALVLMAVVALLLLIACTNVASLLLTRGAARQREMAVRVSLGAGRIRLLRQVLTESLLLATLGGLLGIFLAYLGSGVLARIIASGPEHIELQPRPDWVVLLFAAGVAVLTGMLFGLAPASHAFRSVPASCLRQTGRADQTKPWRLFGKGLVVT
jgi:predicted permease